MVKYTNAPGQAPSAEWVLEVARAATGEDESGADEPFPDELAPLLPAITKFLTTNPGDTHFLFERAVAGKPKVGGNGFGSVTCMEDLCWNDHVLTADPELPDGGRAAGIGSFYEYSLHCQEEKHVRYRDERLAKMGVVIPSGQVAILPQDIVGETEGNAVAGPSRAVAPTSAQQDAARYDSDDDILPTAAPSSSTFKATASSPTRATSSAWPSQSSSSGLRDHSINTLDSLPSPRASIDKGKYRAQPAVVDSDSDDEILFMGGSGPTKKRPTATLTVLSDDEDEVKPAPRSSQSTPSQRKFKTDPSQPWIQVWNSLTMSEKMKTVSMERSDLKKRTATLTKNKGLRALTSGQRMELSDRLTHLNAILQSGGVKSWTPPSVQVMELVHVYIMNQRLRETIPNLTWPGKGSTAPSLGDLAIQATVKPDPATRIPGIPTQPEAGPSTAAFAVPVVRPDGVVPPPPELQAAWNAMDRPSQVQQCEAEHRSLSAYYATLMNPIVHGPLRQFVGDRMLKLREWIHYIQSGRPAQWEPTPNILLRTFPNLPRIFQPQIRQALLGLPGALGLAGLAGIAPGGEGAGAIDPEEYMPERPLGQDLNTFLQDSFSDFNEDTTIEEGMKTLGLATLQDKLPGALFSLMPHQVLGVAFMVKREESSKAPFGGLLCDAMGLGKTVQCIALMLVRDKRPSDFKRSPQLVVAPVAVLAQWKQEIEDKTTKNIKVFIHHGGSRAKTPAQLKQYDVVITTYGVVKSEAKLKNKKQRKEAREAARQRDRDSFDESDDDDIRPLQKGPLFRTKWFRVFLDEAHEVRNKNTIGAKAIMDLDLLHPWYLTGTPIVNTLSDIGPALRFIGAMDDEEFRNRVARIEKKKPRLAAKRTQAILKPLMVRRNKDTEINGVRILNLPPKTTVMDPLGFTAEERAIYSALERRAQIRVNKFIKQGTLMKNYSVVLVLLTRLRQCVNHPWLLRRAPGDEREDDMMVSDDVFGGMDQYRSQDADEYGRAVALLGAPAVEALRQKLEDRYKAMTSDADGQPQDLECSICYEPFDGKEVISSCGHMYCPSCITGLYEQPLRDAAGLTDEQAERGSRNCPMCREVLEKGRFFRACAIYNPPPPEKDEAEEEEEEDVKPADRKPVDRKGKGKKRASDTKDFFEKKPKLEKGKGKAEDVDSDQDELIEEVITPSTKMVKLLELVKSYLAEDPNVKILIFSQFVQFIDILGDFLYQHNIRKLDYTGRMSQGEREEAIRRFKMPPQVNRSVPVLLLSTKAGGVGLNLTVASKVICCDLAWNPATEQQAVDRCHRIGQSLPVHVERLVIEETVEDRLLEIQKHKGLLADGAMGEGDIGKLGRLSVEDIRRLFAIDRDHAQEDD
ncbi:putative ATP-dependent helicase [Vanrija pseudolonga]|uniref:Purtative ATP-dependent helicase n=1 Tax=Vanrija pseudolonga TaxID=143232 RepID=A0AAF0Y2W8_9TREE|nr:purtative ATP-dependent helicase [Vanrija pseudolonga]